MAVGFGAQTLVKDIITGLFIILEGQITIGDVVEVAGHSGRVEAITIRTVRLRDINGHLHVVPFSEVTTVKNITQDQDYHSFEIGVSYNEDVDHVIETIENVGDDLAEGKVTLPLIHALETGTDPEKDLIREALKTEDLPKQMLQDVIRIVRNNGGLEYTKNQANIHAQAAQKCLASLPESQFRHAMKAMVDFSVNRRS
mgnify:CR=1 FL=1